MDQPTQAYLSSLTTTLTSLLKHNLTGIYLHGSAVLNDYNPQRSDVDILVVVPSPLSPAEQKAISNALHSSTLLCPAKKGLELSIVLLSTTQSMEMAAKPKFELHITTAPGDSESIDGHEHEGDQDLVLHFALCRQAGRVLDEGGAAATETFAKIEDARLIVAVRAEVEWALEAGGRGVYAVLIACRAWRWVRERVFASKGACGEWALQLLGEEEEGRFERGVRRVLEVHFSGEELGREEVGLDLGEVEGFVEFVLEKI